MLATEFGDPNIDHTIFMGQIHLSSHFGRIFARYGLNITVVDHRNIRVRPVCKDLTGLSMCSTLFTNGK